MITNKKQAIAMKIKLDRIFDEIPEYPEFEPGIRRVPVSNWISQ